jgi:excisionase family DNA binding protein
MSPLLTQAEAARFLRLSERTLERLRVSGGGPKYVKIGRRVFYRQQDLEAWVADHLVGSTSEAEVGAI